MIHVRNSRDMWGERGLIVTSQDLRVGRAFHSFVFSELGYGATIIQIEPTRMVCRTNYFLVSDEVTFTGSELEMAPLVAAAAYYMTLFDRHDGLIGSATTRPPNVLGDFQPDELIGLEVVYPNFSKFCLMIVLALGFEPSEQLARVSRKEMLESAQRHLNGEGSFLESLPA